MSAESKEIIFSPLIDKVLTPVAEWVYRHLSESDYEHLTILGEGHNLLAKEQRKYDGMVGGLLIAGNFDLLARVFPNASFEGIYPALPPAYYFGRAVDDIADGERDLPNEFSGFSDWIIHLKEIIRTSGAEVTKEESIDFLLKRALYRLEPLQRKDDDIKHEFCEFLDAMEDEHDRRINQTVLTGTELETLNNNSFNHVFNITLVSMRSSVRAKDIPEFSQLLGRSYAIRDLETDLSLGICNIPKEILDESGIPFSKLRENQNLIYSNEVIQTWISGEVDACKKFIEILDARKLDIPGKLLVKIFSDSVRERILGKHKN